jgi:hypothetical protein
MSAPTDPYATPSGWGAPLPPLPAALAPAPAEGTWRDDVVAALVTAVAVLAFAAPVGLVWGHLARRAALVVIPAGGVAVSHGPEDLIRDDALFLLITLVVGIGCGLVAALVCRRLAAALGPGVALGLAGGGLAAAAVAAAVGRRVLMMRLDHARHEPSLRGVDLPGRAVVQLPPLAHATFVWWAFAAVAVFLLVLSLLPQRR